MAGGMNASNLMKHLLRALKHLCKANVLAMHEILKVQPHAIFIQSESSEYLSSHEPGGAKTGRLP